MAGYRIGKKNAAPAKGSELAVADFHDQYPNETYLFFVEPYVSFLPNGRIRINHKKITEDFGAKGYIEAYEDGITQGEMDAMNYFGALSCQKNQYVSKPRPLLRPLYHYDTISQILGKRYPEGMMDQGSFDFICRHTLTESLEFLNRNLLTYGLTWDEKTATMDFFNAQIIDQACQSLYGLYQKKMKPLLERNEEPEGPFYDYSTYYSSTVFLNLMSQWMSGVADYALSYGKGNSEFAGTNGFFMQEIGETLIAEIAPQFQDIIFKNALIYHFDHTRDSVQTMVRNMAAGVSIETRKEKKEVLGTESAGDITALYTANLKAYLDLGLLSDSIKVTLNHRDREWVVYIPTTPKVLNVLHYDHQLLSVIYKFSCECSLEDVLFREVTHLHESLPTESELYSKLQQKLPYEQLEKMPFAKKPLSKVALKNVIEPQLKAIFRSVVNMPHSCYKVKVKYGNGPKQLLLESTCGPG